MSHSPPIKTKKGKTHLRPCVPLQFSAKQSEVILSNICPHRKKFNSCNRYLCTVANEKYQWLELVREKSKCAVSVIKDADQLLRNKLMHSFNLSIKTMTDKHQNELELLRKQLSRKSLKQKLVDENLRFLKFYELDKKDILDTECPLGYTKDHVDFIIRQDEVMREQQYMNAKTAIDHKKCEQSKELIKLRQSINSPISFLDHLLDQHLETIRFHTTRVEKLIIYILNLCVVPRTAIPDPPDNDDPLMVARVKKASSQAFQVLKAALNALAKLCGDIRKIYCNAEEEVMGTMKLEQPHDESLAKEGTANGDNFDRNGENLQIEQLRLRGDDHQMNLGESTEPNGINKSKKLRKLMFNTKNKIVARMSDTKLNDKAILTAIISRSREKSTITVDDSLPSSSPEIDLDKAKPFNKSPCCFCGNRFRGDGKLAPSITNGTRDTEVRLRAKVAVKNHKMQSQKVSNKIDTMGDFQEKKQELLTNLEQSTTNENAIHVFCSWVCVKRWTVMCCPMQYKYQSELLIDMVAGHSVKI